VRRAIEAPLADRQNAGVEGSIVVEKIKDEKGNVGYNAATDVYEDLVKAGVIDPTKVTRTALQNAASVAGLLITTECADHGDQGRQGRHGWNGRHGRRNVLSLAHAKPAPWLKHLPGGRFDSSPRFFVHLQTP
jgi:hypothetical protein